MSHKKYQAVNDLATFHYCLATFRIYRYFYFMRIRLAILVVLIGLLVDIQPSVAADLPLIEPCSVSNVAPCIESFTATSDSGTKLVGKLSGKSFPSKQYFATQAFVGTEYE
jgi:hypothetical protein